MRIDEFEFQDRNGNEIEPTKNQLVIYIKSLHKQIAEFQEQLEKKEKSLEYFRDRVEKAEKEIKDNYKQYNQLVNEYNELLQSNNESNKEIEKLKKQLEEKEKEIEELQKDYEFKDKDCAINLERFCDALTKNVQLEFLIKDLQNEIKSQPAEIVEKIKKEVEKEKDENDLSWLGFKKLDRILNTILKEYMEQKQ